MRLRTYTRRVVHRLGMVRTSERLLVWACWRAGLSAKAAAGVLREMREPRRPAPPGPFKEFFEAYTGGEQ